MALNPKLLFADHYQPDFGIPWIPVLSREVLEKMPLDMLLQYKAIREKAENDAIINPVACGWTLPSWQLVMKHWKNYPIHVLLGGNRACVRADTLIYDPVLKVSRRIDSIKGMHHVYARAKDGSTVIAEAQPPFTKPAGAMLKISLSTGASFVAALEHKVLCSDLVWRYVRELRRGYGLCHLPTTSDTDQPSPLPDVHRSSETALDSQAGYHPSRRLYDELLPAAQDSDQGVSPSLSDAPRRILISCGNRHSKRLFASRLVQCMSGARGNKLADNQVSLSAPRLSIQGGLHPHAAPSADTESHAFCIPYKSVSQLCEGLADVSDYPRSSLGSPPQLRSIGVFGEQDTQSNCGVAYVIDIEPAGIEVKWDMTVPTHENYLVDGIVHHNTKSSFMARLCVWVACTIPEAHVRCYHVNDARSVEDQQKFIWEAIPEKIKNLPVTRGKHHSIQYSQKNGFADGVCIFPPLAGARSGGTIFFGNYRQYQQDEKIAEGFKCHLVWPDEEMPQKLFGTLQYRTSDYHGRICPSFTTIDGWTPMIQDILGKTKTLETRYAKMVNMKLPILQESLSRPGCLIHYFWTEDNPFIDTQDFFTKIKGRPKDEILARAYGIPTKSVTSVFPGFNKEVNVIAHEKLPWLKTDKEGNKAEYKVTRYMACDPAGSKNWFLLWVAIDPAGTWWVYREWPDYDDWALPGNTVEGKPGPAQKGSSRGIKDYVELIKQCEGAETIYERLIDPRLGAAEKQSQDGATTIISDLDDADMTFIPAPGVEIENGLQLINNLLAYDQDKPIDSLNGPKLYISDRCANLIFSMSEYTAVGGRSEASKDPIDCLRYLCCANCEYIEPAAADWGRTGGY